MPKKIALIHIRLMNKGGLETRLINYMNYFLSLGHEVTIITSKISGEIELPKDVHLIKIDLSAYPKFIRHLFFNYKLEKTLEENTFDYTLSLERTWSQDNLIAPNTHIGFLKAQDKWWRNPSDMIQLYLDKKSFRNAKNIFACSQMVKEEIVNEYNIDATKIKVVFPPLNTQKFNLQERAKQKEYLEKYNIDISKINFLFVSTSHKRKGLDLLMEIFSKKENEDKHLYIAGSTAQYKQKNIHSLGFVNNTNELYVCVDATLHPAVYEPYGQIISESIACGTRVIVSDKVGAKEIIKNKELGEIIPANDLEAWSYAIVHFEKKASIPEEILQSITKELSLENHMCKLISKKVN
jgi:glycosyltransferase involved in cell wall biosynthesis